MFEIIKGKYLLIPFKYFPMTIVQAIFEIQYISEL